MEVSNPRDDRAERNRGSAEVPLSKVIPRVGNFHLEQNTILDSFSCTTTPKIWFISRFCVFFRLGENTWVRCNFITQAKSVAISVWCARKGGSIEFPQSMYCSKTKKKVYPCKPQLFWKCLKLKTKSWLNLKFSSTCACVTCNMKGGFLSRAFVFSLLG